MLMTSVVPKIQFRVPSEESGTFCGQEQEKGVFVIVGVFVCLLERLLWGRHESIIALLLVVPNELCI